MQQPSFVKEDLDSKVKRLSDMFETIPPNTIRLHLHNCSGDFDACVQKLLETQKNQESKILKRPDRADTAPPPYTASQKLNLPQLQSEMNKLNEKNFSLLEQKISHQEADISLLKDMIKARDLTIEKLQKELQELRSTRDREKSSAAVVTELSKSIKSSVDSGFKSVENPQGVDFNKLVIEVKKQLAMSFLNDFKDSKLDKSTISSKLEMSSIGPAFSSPAVNLDRIKQPTIQQPTIQQPNNIPTMEVKPTIQQPTIQQPTIQQPTIQQPTIQQPTIQQPTIQQPNNIPFYNLAQPPINNLPYYPPSNTYPKYTYNPPSSNYYNYLPTQPSAPAFYPPSDQSHNQIK